MTVKKHIVRLEIYLDFPLRLRRRGWPFFVLDANSPGATFGNYILGAQNASLEQNRTKD